MIGAEFRMVNRRKNADCIFYSADAVLIEHQSSGFAKPIPSCIMSQMSSTGLPYVGDLIYMSCMLLLYAFQLKLKKLNLFSIRSKTKKSTNISLHS